MYSGAADPAEGADCHRLARVIVLCVRACVVCVCVRASVRVCVCVADISMLFCIYNDLCQKTDKGYVIKISNTNQVCNYTV